MADKIILILLLAPFAGLFLGWINRYIRNIYYTLLSIGALIFLFYVKGNYNFEFNFLNFKFYFVFDSISFFFLLIIWGISLAIFLFSLPQLKEKSDNIYYFLISFLFSITSFLTLSRDIISFFFLWELMSIITFLITVMNKNSKDAAIKYFSFSLAGAYSMLIGIILLYNKIGVVDFTSIANSISNLSRGSSILIFSLIIINFFIKGAVIPFYVWLPDLHGKAECKFSVFLSSVLLKFSILGIVLLYFYIFKQDIFYAVKITAGYLASITFLVMSFIAVFQKSAKRLLAYSSIANISYAITAILLGGVAGFYGGMFHILNHTIFKGLLFIVVAGVVFRTGTDNLDELGGLIKRMPISFVAMLIAIIAATGVPPMNGFVSKWMIYSSLFNNHAYLAMIFLFISSTVSFLYVYRLIHGIFLGQIQEKHLKIKEVPIFMLIPIIVLTLLTMFLGYFPGYGLNIVKDIALKLNIGVLDYTTHTVTIANSRVDTFFIGALFMSLFIISFIIFIILSKSRRVSQYDNYNAGQVLTPEQKYHYTENFYKPFERTVIYWKIFDFNNLYAKLSEWIEYIFDWLRKIYSGSLQWYITVILLFMIVLFYILF